MAYQRVSQVGMTARHNSKRIITDKKAAHYFAHYASTPRWVKTILLISIVLCVITFTFRLYVAVLLLLIPILSCLFAMYIIRMTNTTDEEYDTWLEDRERKLLARGYQKHGISSQDLINSPLCIKSIVPPGSTVSREYRNQNVSMKQGKDGIYRFSINAYTYFFPLQHGMAIFRSNIQASPTHPYFGTKDEMYPYRFLTTAATYAESDNIMIENAPYPYSVEKLHLMFSVGTRVTLSAVVKAYLQDVTDDAPESIIPDARFDIKLNRLRALLISEGTSTKF